jgi:hypothetical protein
MKQEQHPDARDDCPDNATIVGARHYPAVYSIVGSRRYGDHVVIDLQYEWGKDAGHPGDKRVLSYILFREGGMWKLDDIYYFSAEFSDDLATASSLSVELEKFADYLILSARIPSPYVDYQLSGAVTLNQQWLELNPKEPLKVERDTQEVALFPGPPIKMVFDGKGERAADGRDATIEAELIGSDGVTYHSRPGYSQHMTGDLYVTDYSVGFKDLPKDVTFKTVRVRSSAPYPVKKILWRCYTWSEANQ